MQPAKAFSGFRTDINGIRAWAVVAVLLFHFKVPGFSAGFIGVDIFFVISGFLMTGIILRGLERGNFSLWQFYMARARRIVPALMLLLAVLLVLGWFWLPTPDYQQLGTQSAYSLAFLSNIHYWRAAGYFDTAAHEKWLLHTWSLGIEMQFYLLYPVFATLVWKIKPGVKTFAWGLLALFAASLVLSVVASSWKPVAAFYLLPTRGWELAMGGLVYLLSRRSDTWLQGRQQLLYWAGLLLWLAGFVLIDTSLPWPSGWALLPVLGTALIILAQTESALLLSNPLAQWLGNISYSLYLWHWPLVVALYFAGLQQQWDWVIGGLLLSLVLGQLSYRLVENPVRLGLTQRSYWQQVAALGVAGLMIGVAAVGVRLFVFEGRLPAAAEIAAAESKNLYAKQHLCIEVSDKTNRPVDCNYQDGLALGVIAVGDSHNSAVFTALAEAAKKNGFDAMHWARSACPLLKGAEFQNRPKGCLAFNEEVLSRLERTPSNVAVVLASRLTRALIGSNEDGGGSQGVPHIFFDKETDNGFSLSYQGEFKKSLLATSCILSKQRVTFLMRPIPEMGVHVPNTVVRNIMFGRKEIDVKITLDEYHKRHAFVWAAQDEAAEKCGVKILDPLPYLCDDQYCYGSRDGRPLYYDDDHLSEYGNKFLVPMFEQVFKDAGELKGY